MILAAAQLRPAAGDVAANTARHLALVALAAAQGAELIFFPELSWSGYEPRLAQSLGVDPEDPRLDVFQERSDALHLVVGVGVPLAVGAERQIAMLWFAPGEPRRVYAKQLLHPEELPFFVAGKGQLVLAAAEHRLAPAICYESVQPSHAEHAVSLGADIYLASVAKSAEAMAKAERHYAAIARRHEMFVVVSACLGPSDDFVSVGRSAAWNRGGERIAQMGEESEGLVLVDTARGEARVLAG